MSTGCRPTGIHPPCLLSNASPYPPHSLPVDLSFVVVSRDRLSDCAQQLKSSPRRRTTDANGGRTEGPIFLALIQDSTYRKHARAHTLRADGRGKEGEAAGQSERDVNWAFARSLALRDAAQRVARALRGGGRELVICLPRPGWVRGRSNNMNGEIRGTRIRVIKRQ